MLKLLKNCSVYAPKYAGKKDILIMGERIHAVADDLSAWQAAPEIEVYDINGAAVCRHSGYACAHNRRRR